MKKIKRHALRDFYYIYCLLTVLMIEMAMDPDPRFPAGNSFIRGFGWESLFPHEDVNEEKFSHDG